MNAVVNRMTPSITSMIRMDHSHVLALAHRYTPETSANRKRALVTNACIALQVHAQLEEEIFYPALREVLPGNAVLEKSEPEHQQMRDLIGELQARLASGEPIDQTFDEKFMTLVGIVMHHAADEETQLLPAAERLLRDDLPRLGAEMARRRMELLKPHARELATSTARSFPVGATAGAALFTAGAVAVGAMLFSRGRNGRASGKSRRAGLSDRDRSRLM